MLSANDNSNNEHRPIPPPRSSPNGDEYFTKIGDEDEGAGDDDTLTRNSIATSPSFDSFKQDDVIDDVMRNDVIHSCTDDEIQVLKKEIHNGHRHHNSLDVNNRQKDIELDAPLNGLHKTSSSLPSFRNGEIPNNQDDSRCATPDTRPPSRDGLQLNLNKTPTYNNSTTYKSSPTRSRSSKSSSGSRKKKRGTSWKQVLSPSYKHKSDDFRKFFKDLPETERLLVDYTCALVKDILIQGRMYVSQNYISFHSNILKWQTAVCINFKDIKAVTKEKTVKVIPNAIQFLVQGKGKLLFTTFNTRDRAYKQIQHLWQNALQDTPMTPQELWSKVRDHYGSDLGISSEEDYQKRLRRLAAASGCYLDEFSENASNNNLKTQDLLETRSNSEASLSEIVEPVDESSCVDSQESKDNATTTNDSSPSVSTSKSNDDVIGDVTANTDDVYTYVDHVVGDLKQVYFVTTYPTSVQNMFRYIYGDDPFWLNYLKGRDVFDIHIGEWTDGGSEYENCRIRKLDYVLNLNHSLGPKTSKVDEVQILHKSSVPNSCYAVDCLARNHGIPYADYFQTVMRYTFRSMSPNTCELRVSAELQYRKNPWGLVKNFIEKNAYKGIEENFEKLEREIRHYLTQQHNGGEGVPTSTTVVHPTIRRVNKDVKVEGQAENVPVKEEPLQSTAADEPKMSPFMTSSSAPLMTSSSRPYQHSKQQQNNESFSKWYIAAVALLFILLLVNNISMYRRIGELEKFQELHIQKMPAFHQQQSDSTLDSTSTCHKNDPSMAELSRGILKLQETLESQIKLNQQRWEKMQSDWNALHDTISKQNLQPHPEEDAIPSN